MSAAQIRQGDQILRDRLADLQQHQSVASTKMIGGNEVDLHAVLRESLDLSAQPDGHRLFVQYAVVWLQETRAPGIVFDPGDGNFNDSLTYLNDYANLHWQTRRAIMRRLVNLGEHIVRRLLQPMMAKPSSTSPSATSTPSRPSELREAGLERDGNRCTITRTFNLEEAKLRGEQHGNQAADDDGVPLKSNEIGHIEVAHIIPHLLAWRQNDDPATIQPQMNVFRILRMFHPNASVANFGGQIVDSPENVITLEPGAHRLFGNLEIYFEPAQSSPNTYTVHYVKEPHALLSRYPCDIRLRTVSQIPQPSPALFAIHRACALIAHASGAAEAISNAFSDSNDGAVRADGSTPLDLLLSNRMIFRHCGYGDVSSPPEGSPAMQDT